LNKTAWIVFSVATVGILALLIALSGSSKLDVSQVDINAIQTASSQNGNISDHIFGSQDSTVTLIEYGDFQCPGCGAQHVVTKELVNKYVEQLRFVFRNFPLTSIHPNAKAAAATVEAAGIQGKYWEMHDMVYESQADWSNLSISDRTAFFENYASQLNLDVDKFNSDVNGNDSEFSVSTKINYDTALGKKAGVDATPSFYLNGIRLSSDVWGDKTKFEQAIIDELTKADIQLPE
jgi:protein-disulfide isomerase